MSDPILINHPAKSDNQIRIDQFHSYIARIAERLDAIKQIQPEPNEFLVRLYDAKDQGFTARLNVVHGLVVLSPIWPTYSFNGRAVQISVDLIDLTATEERRNRLLFSYDLGSLEAMVLVRDRFLPYLDYLMERCREQYSKEIARREWMDETIAGLKSALKPVEAVANGNELRFNSTTFGQNVAIAEKDSRKESVQLILSTTREEAEYILVFLADQLQRTKTTATKKGGKR